MEEELFDIDYYLPIGGGSYHCTIAVGVNQAYVDKVKIEYEKGLQEWRIAPSAWKLPFYHSLKITKHTFMPNNSSFIRSEDHTKKVDEARKDGEREGMKKAISRAKYYITNKTKLAEFEADSIK